MNDSKRLMIILVCILHILAARWAFCAEELIMQGMAEAHNQVRADVGVQRLVWSDELAAFAQQWADHLARAKGCEIEHRKQQGGITAAGPGENIYWASAMMVSDGTRVLQEITPEKVVQEWADEAGNYSYETNTCREGSSCGHYTQVIWHATKRVGCGRAVCSDNSQVWVCNYEPPGNVLGKRPY